MGYVLIVVGLFFTVLAVINYGPPAQLPKACPAGYVLMIVQRGPNICIPGVMPK